MEKINRNIWLTSKELADLECRTAIAVRKHCQLGRYKTAKKVKSHGGGIMGRMWKIKLSDPAISDEIIDRFHFKRLIESTIKELLQERIEEIEKTLQELCRKRR